MLSGTASGLMVDSLAGAAAEISLHSGDPAAVGSHEIKGAGRQSVTLDVVERRALRLREPIVFRVPERSKVAGWGVWDAYGAFLLGGTFDQVDDFPRGGFFELQELTITVWDRL